MTLPRDILAALLTAFFLCASAAAEDLPGLESLQTLELSRLPVNDLLKTLGEPDKKFSKNGTESWYYGKSTIFIADGRVTAWSDSGDLAERQLLKRLRPNGNTELELPGFAGWKNDWTTEPPVSVDDVVDEIIEK